MMTAEYSAIRRAAPEDVMEAWGDMTEIIMRTGRRAMKLMKGTILKARGGWDAEVIWINSNNESFYAIHKPRSEVESDPVWHDGDGRSSATFTINEPPFYDADHPADLEMGEYEL